MSDEVLSIDAVGEVMGKVRRSVATVIEGKPEAIDMALTVLLAEGHLLLEDVPGVGKTMLAKALGRSIDATVHRIQFTPDLLPSDITGVSIYNQQSQSFEFKPGGIFANIVIGDEINRASPKTQSAMLESMEELQVSADGTTHQLERPFMVIATQNPIEMEGTYPLPEAQRDRFMAKISLGYPSRQAELDMLDNHGEKDPIDAISPVTDAGLIRQCIAAARAVHVSGAMKDYLMSIVATTRTSPLLRLGASPRSSLQMLRAAKATAAMAGRDFVIPEDISGLAVPVMGHRLITSAEAQLARKDLAGVITDIVAGVAVPGER